MIIARDIAIEAGARRLISHASFTVHAGDKIGLVGLVAMTVFLAILVVGFIYEWKKGALEWE